MWVGWGGSYRDVVGHVGVGYVGVGLDGSWRGGGRSCRGVVGWGVSCIGGVGHVGVGWGVNNFISQIRCSVFSSDKLL